jgi:hypothetical protein
VSGALGPAPPEEPHLLLGRLLTRNVANAKASHHRAMVLPPPEPDNSDKTGEEPGETPPKPDKLSDSAAPNVGFTQGPDNGKRRESATNGANVGIVLRFN